MSNFLARCAAIGLVGGGFAVTGDLGWLAARAVRVVNARSVPSEQPGAPADTATGARPQPAAAPLPAAPPATPPAADPFRSPPAPPPVAAREPVAPPAGGLERIAFGTLPAGERITLWIGRRTAGGRQPHVSFDLVDPAAGEALLVGAGLGPRRVKVGTGHAGATAGVALGDTLVIRPVGPAHHAGAAGETVGPVTAIAVGRR